MNDATRQTGRTTTQMRDAPRGSMYVWCNERLGYPRALAKSIARDDLVIVTPEMAFAHAVRGTRVFMTVDHALPEFVREQRARRELSEQVAAHNKRLRLAQAR